MGGKHKQAQRTKNNARPSSSGRSAELLGSSIPQFVGFSTVKDTSFVLPGLSLSTSDDVDSTLDPNFQLVLKKMNKKDATTKLKALQEFTELVKNTEPEAVKAVLPFWPRLYGVLAIDVEHRVREAAHTAHHQVVLKAKRNLAPFLKLLAGPWFTSQYDTYAPAATAASESFQAAFPPNKLQEAIIYCQEEILSYICDNLTLTNVQVLSNQKMSSEDTEAKYERILISSLQGYSLYLNKVPVEQVEKTSDYHNKLIANNKFWKLAKNKLPNIRTAWFGVITTLCQKSPFLLENEANLVVSTVLSNLDENEPAVLSSVWEAALLTITTVQEWWKYVNFEKMFLPKLWKILNDGGRGNATAIYPYLLPLISHLPPDINFALFYKNYFDNMTAGLELKSVSSSRSESLAVATAFIECMQYVVLKNVTDTEFCENLIKTQLIRVLSNNLLQKQSSYKIVFSKTSGLVQYWSRNSQQSNLENYGRYVDFFWLCLDELLQKTLEVSSVIDVANQQIELFQALKHTVKPKKQLKVKFTVDELQEAGDAAGSSSTCNVLKTSYLKALHDLVYKVSETYVKLIEKKKIAELCEYLYYLIQDFNPECFFKYLANKLVPGEPSNNLGNIYHNLLSNWLKCDVIRTKNVVDITFLLMKYLKDEDKIAVLETFASLDNEECLSWCIGHALSHPHNLDEIIQKWLNNSCVNKFLVHIVEMELKGDCPSEYSALFKLAFTESNSDGGLLISNTAVFEIIQKLSILLLSPTDYPLTIDTCSSLAAYISAILYSESLLLSYGDKLLLSLFTLTCNCRVDPETLSSDTLWEANTAWQDAVSMLSSCLSQEEFKNLTLKLAEIVENEILNSSIEDINTEHLVNVIVNFVKCVQKNVPLKTGELLMLFFVRNYIPKWRKSVMDACTSAEYLSGNLSSPNYPIKETNENIKEDDIVKYFLLTHMKVNVFSTCLDYNKNFDEDDGSDYDDERNGDIILKLIDDAEMCIVDVLYDIALAKSFVENYKTVQYENKICDVCNKIISQVKILLNTLDNKSQILINKQLAINVYEKNWLWCKSVYILNTEILTAEPSEIYEQLVKVKPEIEQSQLGLLHLTQTFAKHLSYDNIDTSKFTTLEKVVILRSMLHCNDIEVQIADVLANNEKLIGTSESKFLLDDTPTAWDEAQVVIEILRSCESLVKYKVNCLARRQWDFGVILLATWSSNAVKAKSLYDKPKIAALIISVIDFFTTVDKHITLLKKESALNNFVNEWEDLFVQSIHTDIVQIWYYLAEQFEQQRRLPINIIPLIEAYNKVFDCLNYTFIFSNNDGTLPKWPKFLKKCCSLLTHPLTNIQIWSYRMLVVLIPGLIEVDSVAVNTNTPHEKGLIYEQFKDLLLRTQEIVQTMLLDFKLGEDSCRVEPFTDSYTYTFAYLLLWDFLLKFCEKSSTELRYQYADWSRNEDFLKNLLTNIFRLMPTEVLHYTDSKTKPLLRFFITKPNLNVDEMCNSELLEHIVCSVYVSTLSQLPALVRQWWTGTDTRIGQIVERVTAAYVSPQLCLQELTEVSQHETKFKNMVVKVFPYIREVIAVYTVDEAQMELVITLPTNYPLGGPDVQCNRQIGGTSHRQWLMQLKMCVLHQNGRIWDGLSLWNNNLDKKFDGVEECYICYAVLHPGTYQLPKLCCQTCKKKFHSACLYKWFSTSHKSTCPICRNLF